MNKKHGPSLFLWFRSDGSMTHLSFLVTSLSHLSPLFTHDLWPRKMERRKLCSVGHLEDPVWNWNEHKSLGLLSFQKRPSDSFCSPVPQKKIKGSPVFDLNVWLTGGPFYTLGKTKPFPPEDLSKHENSPHSNSLSPASHSSAISQLEQQLLSRWHWWNFLCWGSISTPQPQ